MSYEYLPETATADIAFRARGKTLPELFTASADAMMNVMIEDLKTIERKEMRTFSASNTDLELLLFDFLQEIIFFKDSEQLLLRASKVDVSEEHGKYTLNVKYMGETLDPARHEQRVDVKAVTLHHFRIERTPQGWSSHVILDI